MREILTYGSERDINNFNKRRFKRCLLNINEESPFWITAKELLSDEDYKLLKEEIVGKERKSKIRGKRRNI